VSEAKNNSNRTPHTPDGDFAEVDRVQLERDLMECEAFRHDVRRITDEAASDPIALEALFIMKKHAHRERAANGFGIVEEDDPDYELLQELSSLPVADPEVIAAIQGVAVGGIVHVDTNRPEKGLS
jgi:hypothetical protein